MESYAPEVARLLHRRYRQEHRIRRMIQYGAPEDIIAHDRCLLTETISELHRVFPEFTSDCWDAWVHRYEPLNLAEEARQLMQERCLHWLRELQGKAFDCPGGAADDRACLTCDKYEADLEKTSNFNHGRDVDTGARIALPGEQAGFVCCGGPEALVDPVGPGGPGAWLWKCRSCGREGNAE